jgi:hypothetical protein
MVVLELATELPVKLGRSHWLLEIGTETATVTLPVDSVMNAGLT